MRIRFLPLGSLLLALLVGGSGYAQKTRHAGSTDTEAEIKGLIDRWAKAFRTQLAPRRGRGRSAIAVDLPCAACRPKPDIGRLAVLQLASEPFERVNESHVAAADDPQRHGTSTASCRSTPPEMP
jgi:hypothetical protein